MTTGCSFTPGKLAGGDDTQPDDAAIDSPDGLVDAPSDGALCALWTPAPKHFAPCAIPQSSDDLVLTAAASPYNLDTATGILTSAGGPVTITTSQLAQTNGPTALLVSVGSLFVEPSATLTVVGDKPLVIASFNSISVAGTIDATSRVGGTAGAGANPTSCGTSTGTAGTDEADNGGGSGGGGGGAFRGAGGQGGPGDNQNPGGAGGLALPSFPIVVRGGCAGGVSGKAGPDPSVGNNDNFQSAGGAGGGAVELSARNQITVQATGRILAGGAGGAGTIVDAAAGGGGGGAGGYIALEAPAVTAVTGGILAANGGGGGSSAQFVGTGNPGQDGQPSATAANGGASTNACAPAGGVGSAGATLNGTAASQAGVACGGGGGGGGAGFIGVFSATFTNGAVFSPSPQPFP